MKELNFDLNLEVKRLSEQWPEKSESIEKVLNSLEPRIEKKLFLQFLESFEESIETKNEFQFQVAINLARRIIQSQEDLQAPSQEVIQKASLNYVAIGIASSLGIVLLIIFFCS
ncbi:MAG: hypothetical protein CL674_06400 [Bdellovibrionaceae bacterium]|nr:hypothetical protein [Pseudobdellovibrionaceae bacterium]|tara:strand:- start:9650 stop:9991 length:342 start_codon:yes stop_codon:yes gene_type:complete